jgi:hypothetical protein
MDLPEGLIAVPKGGRPAAIARDVAVWLAYHWRRHKGEQPKAARIWVMEYFKFTEESQVRRAIRKAKKKELAGDGTVMVVGDGLFCVPGIPGMPPAPGSPGWAWAAPMKEPIQIRVTGTTSVRFPLMRAL